MYDFTGRCMILLDTHVLIWLDEGNKRLGKKARGEIDKALKAKKLAVAAISFWEVGMLVNRDHLTIDMTVDAWRNSLLEHGLQEIPLQGDIAVTAANLEKFHGDPADRLIVATSMISAARLCTADKQILAYKKMLKCLDAGK